MKEGKWSKEEKMRYIENAKKWRSELVRYNDFNVYYHPDKPTLPYRRTYQNGYVKMVRWNVNEDGKFSVLKDNERYTLSIFDIETGKTPKDTSNEIQVSIPRSLEKEFMGWLSRKVESPF